MSRSSGTGLLLKGAVGIVTLLALGWIVLTLVEILFSVVYSIVSTLALLLVFGAIGYAFLWMAARLLLGSGDEGERSTDGPLESDLDLDLDIDSASESSSESSSRLPDLDILGSSDEPEGQQVEKDPVEKLHEQYAEGKLDEREFEAQLEQHMETRSLEREVGMDESLETERN